MKIVIENAGAQRGFLLLEEKGEWLIEVEGTAEPNANAEVIETARLPVDKRERLAASVVNFVARTRESVVLNDVTREGLFTRDPYVRQHEPKSLLCMPLLNQGNLIGILYLENNLTTGAFTPARQEVLYMLSSQAAISIENARLYAHQVALTNGYSRFVPRDFLRILNKGSIVEVQLSDHVQHEAAILFSDIRDFTTLSEPMTPQENFDFVNDYLGRVSPVIREYRGFIVKYLGDGMMAVFPEKLEDALDASIAKLRAVDQYNQERQALGEPPIRIGIGVHTGRMTLGTVGEAERLQGDLLSDAVNLASRLEGLTKLYGAALIVSAEALMKVEDPGRYRVRFLGSTQVKGRQEAVSIFELLDGEPDTIAEQKWQTKGDFEQALMAYYEGRFNEASDGFSTVLHHSPTDTAARLYLSRTKQLLTNGVPAGWTGVEALLEK
jgi:class 3 adenylate cyclase